MDRKLLMNYFYNILYQLVKIALPIVIVPYTMGHLGASTLGISDFAGNIASWFILFGVLGCNLYGNREIAKVREDRKELSKTFFEILIMQWINMAFACILYVIYVSLTVSADRIIYYLYVFTILASALDITWFFYGVEDFKSASIRNIIVKIIGVIFIFILVKTHADLWKYVLINSFSELFGQFIMFVRLKEYISFVKVDIIEAYRKHIKGTFVLFIPTVAISVYTLLDQTMIGYLTNDTAYVSTYKASQGFVKMFLYFITSIGTVMLPRITNVFYHHGGNKEAQRYVNTTIKLAALLAVPMMCGMIAVAPKFIPWYLPKQPEIITLIQVSAPIILCISLSNVFGTQYLVPTGKNREYTLSVVIGALVNFFANLILIPLMQGVGAAIGSVFAESAVTLVQYHFVKDELHIKLDRSYFIYVMSALIMTVFVVLIGMFMEASLMCNVIQATVGVIIYGIILVISREELSMSVLKKVFKR